MRRWPPLGKNHYKKLQRPNTGFEACLMGRRRGWRAIVADCVTLPKRYAAGLEIHCPGGALFQTGALKSPAIEFQQWLCHRMPAG